MALSFAMFEFALVNFLMQTVQPPPGRMELSKKPLSQNLKKASEITCSSGLQNHPVNTEWIANVEKLAEDRNDL